MTEFTPEQFRKFCLDLMKNREAVTQSIIETIAELDKINSGTMNVIESIENGSDANVKKQLKNNMIAVTKITASVKKVLMLQMVDVMSSDFAGKVAGIGVKLGGGSEFLQEMFKQKMGGK